MSKEIIAVNGEELEFSTFPSGEEFVRLDKFTTILYDSVEVFANIRTSQGVMRLFLTLDAIKRYSNKDIFLSIPYIPYGRQDRVCTEGEPLSLKVFADLLNSFNVKNIVTYDPHSDVTSALINNLQVIPQHQLVFDYMSQTDYKDHILVAPDAGAEKKVTKYKQNYISCSKNRDPKTGEIVSTRVNGIAKESSKYLIVDDICDGGRTFIEVAKALRASGAKVVDLYVTHGHFNKGFDVFKGYLNKIHYMNPSYTAIETEVIEDYEDNV